MDVTRPGTRGAAADLIRPSDAPIDPLDEYGLRVLRTQRRGGVYPYELIRLLTPPPGAASDFPSGDFAEYDLDAANELVAGDAAAGREHGQPRGRR